MMIMRISGARGLTARAATKAFGNGRIMETTHLSISCIRQYHDDRSRLLQAIGENENIRNTMSYSLSMASIDGNKFPPLTQPLSDTQREQIRISALQHHHMKSPSYTEHQEGLRQNRTGGESYNSKQQSSLPKTLQDALRPTSRAIVVTETSTPFRVFNVNKAWEDLCGYTYLESKGRSLGSLLKGEETDQVAVTSMIHQLLHGEEAIAVLTNYTKDGRRFRNRLHVGPLFDDLDSTEDPSYFVGVLQEV